MRARVVDRCGRWLFLLTLGVYSLTAGGSLTTTDAVVSYDVTEGIIRRGTVALSSNLLGNDAERGRDGRYYSPFGIGQSIYNIPFYLVGQAAVRLGGLRLGKPDSVPKAAVALGQVLVAAAIVWQTYRLSWLVTGDVGAASGAALVLAFGSLLWPYSKFGFNQPLACATLLLAVTSACRAVNETSTRAALAAGGWLATSLLTRHEMAIASVPIGTWLLLAGQGAPSERRQRFLAFVSGVTFGVLSWMTFNAWRFGNPFDSGLLHDDTPGLGSPVIPGLLALLFSPAASVFLYSPMTALGVLGLVRGTRRARAAGRWLASIAATFLVFYATVGNWLAGRSYGGRYLVVILPYLAVGVALWLTDRTLRRHLLTFLALAAIGVVVQMPGVLVDYAKVSQAAAARHGAFTTAERQWRSEASGLVLNTEAMVTAVPENLRYLAGLAPRPALVSLPDANDRFFSQQFAFSLDFWWLYLFYLGAISRATLAVVVGGLVAWCLLCARRLATELAPVGWWHPKGRSS